MASGHRQPRLREDSQAYWDDSKPTPQPIIINSSSPLEAGQSPQDSRMNSPESEEPTVPASAHTQVGPATMQAIQIALDRMPEQPSSSRELWDNVPSLPANLPPQAEVIEVRGRPSDTSRTPCGRSHANSNASVWSHATVETISSTGDETTGRLLLQASHDPERNLGGRFETALQAIKTGMLPNPFNPDDIPVNQLPPPEGVDDDWDNALTKAISWGAYTLVDNLDLHRVHDLPFDGRTIHAAVAATLLTLDAGGAKEDGEMAVGAIVMMCQQLGGLFKLNANHSKGRGHARYPDSYFERLTHTITHRIDCFDREFPQLPSHDPPDLPAPPPAEPLMEAQKEQAMAKAKETLYNEMLEELRIDEQTMAQINASVKDGIFADLNAQALNNADEWRAVYKHKFVEAMHSAFEAQYPGIHPNKGKAWAMPPITESQVVRDAQPCIQEEVRLQVQARIRNIHQEIQESLAAEEPFWKEGPLQDAIADTVWKAAQKEAEDLTAQDIANMKTEAEDNIQQMRQQLTYDLDRDIARMKTAQKAKLKVERQLLQEQVEREVTAYKAGVELDLKAWKDLSRVKHSAERLGYKLIPNGPPSQERVHLDAPTNDLEVFGALVVKRICTEDLEPASPLHPYPNPEVVHQTLLEFYTRDLADRTALPLPPPTPMEEDFDYALEVKADIAAANNGGLEESIHTPLAHPTPIPAHNPSVPPWAALLDAQSEEPAMAPIPSRLMEAPSQLADPTLAPPSAAGDGLTVMLAAINATISHLIAPITERLDAQDQRIMALTKSSDPRPKPKPMEAKGTKGKAVVAATPSPPVPSTSGAKAMDETPAHVARVDDPAEEPPMELTTEGAAGFVTAPAPSIIRSGFQPSPDKVIPLTTNTMGKPSPSTNMPPSWATLTKAGISQQQKTAAHANAVKQGTGWSMTGKARPETVACQAQSGNTEATIICRLGLDDITFKLTIRKMSPTNIVAETCGEIKHLSGGKAHNFVYTFKGDLPFSALYPLRNVLTKPLHVGHLVPNDGWTHAQLRNVATSNSDGVVPNPSQLEEEIRRNPAFENTIFCITPHWAGSLNNIANKPRGTVNMAYVDEKGHLTGKARANGVFMYNERTNYVVMDATALATPPTPRHALSQSMQSAVSSAAARTTPWTMPPIAPTHMIRSGNANASSAALTAGRTTMHVPLTAG
ncbi:hypothetical protein EDB89DRAFT_1905213 [Lactarius sanguifluus]|nr:hypothetical protein EDB89DRAFT_1905213 [Lactarius sanguifluus]